MKTIKLTDAERSALQMLHFACNGAATVTCPGSDVLGTLNNMITELMRGNVEHAALILSLIIPSEPIDRGATYSVTVESSEFTATIDRAARMVHVVLREGGYPRSGTYDFRRVMEAFEAHYGVRLTDLRGAGAWAQSPNGLFTQTIHFDE